MKSAILFTIGFSFLFYGASYHNDLLQQDKRNGVAADRVNDFAVQIANIDGHLPKFVRAPSPTDKSPAYLLYIVGAIFTAVGIALCDFNVVGDYLSAFFFPTRIESADNGGNSDSIFELVDRSDPATDSDVLQVELEIVRDDDATNSDDSIHSQADHTVLYYTSIAALAAIGLLVLFGMAVVFACFLYERELLVFAGLLLMTAGSIAGFWYCLVLWRRFDTEDKQNIYQIALWGGATLLFLAGELVAWRYLGWFPALALTWFMISVVGLPYLTWYQFLIANSALVEVVCIYLIVASGWSRTTFLLLLGSSVWLYGLVSYSFMASKKFE